MNVTIYNKPKVILTSKNASTKIIVGVLKIIENKSLKKGMMKHPDGLLWMVGENYCRKPYLTSVHISKFNSYTKRSSFDPVIISEIEDPKLGDFVFDEKNGNIGEIVKSGIHEDIMSINSVELAIPKRKYPKILYKTLEFPEQFTQAIVDGIIKKDDAINIECFKDNEFFTINSQSKLIIDEI